MPESFPTLAALRDAATSLWSGDAEAEARAIARDHILTKPPGSLGRLESIARWHARWRRGRPMTMERIDVIVFAGNHGVVAQGVSAWPSAVTAQMVGNFRNGGAAINQLSRVAGATLRVVEVAGLAPTSDFTTGPAMDETAFLAAVDLGYASVSPEADLLCLGEMGIGNTTVAATLSAGLFGGSGTEWAGRGAGIDDEGLARKARAIDAALSLHGGVASDPLEAARRLGGYELAAIMGATLAARRHGVPVLLDGFVCTAAAAPLARLAPDGLDHALLSHRSAEAGHTRLAVALGMEPLLDLGLRLGEASGAALAAPLVRAAVACHAGMATFDSAGVATGDDASAP
ncbi:nicotinate-nucleotide-dimethylbenzimidazole phosphoribosyltransferase [Acetobacter nitrogenifigens DSM 23921 = NBRC 105050]|uniref:Nicotinate-nucleotide--dimethylbenzimidazole phosphoribosyltransferase n=1 Tax=Acetobacter nitrogenifigens DSM 23921 = NBRC 105050 TaxID=1120919 RepID=A0A511X6Z1_9PROT|nr:nicotinate-nucleotide--dimethylbenzimidazole phosphoribosyltransferase [Acetobacter nitrogenifigens]GBQ95115.1 nicotinate-nucleotide-dimethylbenzimidazole phosphoribosyltransferase [Acetobacter nitrogenifigens DSM 23921 = NBRC 105050]GEN58714.1 nicotinate-nucleotide--dimethylbenzimidazole phosphoribosyltransferase [Acetobacter nitrogenifigens DSM 23921 = NBRC 105050]